MGGFTRVLGRERQGAALGMQDTAQTRSGLAGRVSAGPPGWQGGGLASARISLRSRADGSLPEVSGFVRSLSEKREGMLSILPLASLSWADGTASG